MKRQILFSFALLVVFSLSLNSCKKFSLNGMVYAINKKCPITLGEEGRLDKISTDANNLFISYTLNDKRYNIDNMKERPDDAKQWVLSMIGIMEDDNLKLMEEAVKAQVNVCFSCTGLLNKKKADIILSPQQVEEAIKNGKERPREMNRLELWTSLNNLSCPRAMTDIVMIQRYELEGSDVVVQLELDEKVITVAQLINQQKKVKKICLQSLKKETMSGLNSLENIQMLIETKHDLVYRYHGSKTQKQLDVRMAQDDLKELLQ